jgi:glycosyltransferase involved in cell wall biosynthesis
MPGVLQLLSSTGAFGIERVAIELGLHLKERGWSAHIGALQAPWMRRVLVIDEARRRGLQTVLFPCGGRRNHRAVRQIQDYVEANGIDVAHGHSYKSNVFLWLAEGGRRRSCRLVSTCHNWLTDSIKLMVYELFDKLCLNQFDHVVVVSPQLDQELGQAGVPPERRSMIDNGVSLEAELSPDERGALRRSLGAGDGDSVLMAVGRMDPWKAYDRLLEAFALLSANDASPPCQLVLVGDGELRAELEERARARGIAERVTFTGYRRDVGRLLLAADQFVISSRKEALPMVLLEAMGARLPVVATRVGGIPRAVGDAAILVPPEDPVALSAALLSLLCDPGRRGELAARLHARYQARYSRRAMGEAYISLYERLMD